MPRLLPRTDQAGWETPALSDISESPPAVSFNDAQKEQEINLFRTRLAQLGVNANVMDVQPMPSHLRFHLRPAGDSLATDSYEQFIGQLRDAMPELKKVLGATAAEVMVAPQKPLIVQVLVRPANHTHFELTHLLRRREFIDQEPSFTLPVGLNLFEETVLTRHLDALRNLLVVGEATARFHLLASILTTLAVFNTPREVRYALIGQDTDPFDQLAQMPHVLGGTLTTTRELRRLLDGLVKHLGQRKQQFERMQVTHIDAYNAALDRNTQKPFPRLVIVIDTIPFEETWKKERESWFSGLYRLVKEGPAVGIYTILTANSLDTEHLPPQLLNLLGTRLVLRPAIQTVEWETALPPLPTSFVDAVFKENSDVLVPLELSEVGDKFIGNLIKYWRQAIAKRSMAALAQGRQRPTGDTGLLTLRQDARLKTALLRNNKAANNKATNDETPGAKPSSPTPDKPAVPAPESRPATPARRATAEPPPRLPQSKALAAYLGWLAVGPLVDVLQLSLEEARDVIAALQEAGVIESGAGPVWRFVRLDKSP